MCERVHSRGASSDLSPASGLCQNSPGIFLSTRLHKNCTVFSYLGAGFIPDLKESSQGEKKNILIDLSYFDGEQAQNCGMPPLDTTMCSLQAERLFRAQHCT